VFHAQVAVRQMPRRDDLAEHATDISRAHLATRRADEDVTKRDQKPLTDEEIGDMGRDFPSP
jgi:hypothetical protein